MLPFKEMANIIITIIDCQWDYVVEIKYIASIALEYEKSMQNFRKTSNLASQATPSTQSWNIQKGYQINWHLYTKPCP